MIVAARILIRLRPALLLTTTLSLLISAAAAREGPLGGASAPPDEVTEEEPDDLTHEDAEEEPDDPTHEEVEGAPDNSDDELEVHPASACPHVFGRRKHRRANRHRREDLVYWIDEHHRSVSITYRGDWKRPRQLLYEGVELLDTRVVDGEAEALVELPELPELGCEAGVYAVHRDDSFFRESRVLAVLRRRDLMLIEAHGQLGYVIGEGARVPTWRISWDSGIAVRPPGEVTVIQNSSGSRARRRSRRSPRRKARRKARRSRRRR